MSHRWTWECPERKKDHIDRNSGEIRRNRYRNQIDFILLRNSNKNLVTNSRSHGNLKTNTDHKLVRMSMSLKLYKCYSKTQTLNTYDTRKLISSNQTKNKYQEKQKELYIQSIDKINNKSPQEIWNAVVGSSIKAANEIIPSEKKKKHKSNSEKIRELSNHQKELKNKINSLNAKHEIRECRRERNKVMKELHRGNRNGRMQKNR